MPIGVYEHKRRPLADRFWEKVDKRGSDECWEWKGGQNGVGYGMINRGRRGEGMMLATRVSWEIHNGPIPDGKFVCHHCDNPGCVNPAHLWLGTQADNIHDMIAKGRRASTQGEADGNSKLTKKQVCRVPMLTIQGYSQRKIAQMLGVSKTTIWAIIHGKNWGWLTGLGENQCTVK